MIKYRRHLATKQNSLDNPQIRAAINLVNAAENNEVLDATSLKILSDSFSEIFGGINPADIFQQVPIGFAFPNGRPKDYGFKTCDVAASIYELARRGYLAEYGETMAISMAKRYTIDAFDMEPGLSSTRMLDRYLAESTLLKDYQSDEVLRQIIAPYEKRQN